MTDEGVISVIVVSWNTRDLLRVCLASAARRLASTPHEMIVVDNASSDGSADMVAQEFPSARLVRNAMNLGFGVANNAAMALSRGEFFLLLNSDARLVDDSILRLVALLRERPEVGVVGPRLRFEDGRLQASAHRFTSLRRLALEELGLYKLLPRRARADLLLGGYWDHETEREVDWVVGACMLVRSEVFEQTGGFDPEIFLYGEEEEWCSRIRAGGWSVLFSPTSQIVHVGHVSAHLLLGPTGRVDRCLLAADRFLKRRAGPVAAILAPAIRLAGASLKLSAFTLRGLVKDDSYGRDVRWAARTVIGHYVRRAAGRV